MKTEFKVGDRVGFEFVVTKNRDMESYKLIKGNGTIEDVSDGILLVKFDQEVMGYSRLNVSPRVCRRLKPKAKPREWTIKPSHFGPMITFQLDGPNFLPGESVHVREVRAKK